MTNSEVLKVRKLVKKYGEQYVLKGVNFELGKGEFVSILGPNGAGKTTFVKIVSGTTKPTSGEVRIFGKDVSEFPGIKRKVGVLSHDTFFYRNLTGLENLKFYAKMLGLDTYVAVKWARIFGMEKNLKKRFSEFSRGMKVRLSLARVFMAEPEILLLDEPFSGLDPSGVEKTLDIVKSHLDRSYILITHRLDIAVRMSDRILVMMNGKFTHEFLKDEFDIQTLQGVFQ